MSSDWSAPERVRAPAVEAPERVRTAAVEAPERVRTGVAAGASAPAASPPERTPAATPAAPLGPEGERASELVGPEREPPVTWAPPLARAPLAARRRLHPAGTVLLALSALREVALPLLFGVVAVGFGGSGFTTEGLLRSLSFGAIAIGYAVLAGLVTWRTTTYRVTDEALEHHRGVLSMKETSIPLTRIQSLDTVENPVQRILGVVAVHVQTAGGRAGGELVLPAVAAEEAQRLRDAVAARSPARPASVAPAVAAGPERRLTRGRLAVTALTAGQLGIILPVLAAASQVLDDLFIRDGTRPRVPTDGFLPESPSGWLLAAAALLVLAWALSVAGAVISFAGFTVRREDDRLRISRGLFARREATVPIARVQGIRVVEGLLRRPFGLSTLRVEVAGYAAEASAAQTVFPLLRRDEVLPFLAELLPEHARELEPLAAPPARAARRYVLPPAAAGLAAGGALAVGVPALGLWPLLLAVPLALHGWLRYRAAGWRITEDFVVVRDQRLARTTVAAPIARLQEHALEQGLLQRRGELADVGIAVGAGTRTRIRHLEVSVARELWERLRSAA